MKQLVTTRLFGAAAVLVLVGCTSVPAGINPVPTSKMKDQCYQHASRSGANCEFMNQGNPEGLSECRKNTILANNRCERLAD